MELNDTPASAPASLQEKIQQSVTDLESAVSADPIRAALFAAGGGFILSRLPLLSIIVGLIRLALWLVRPALVVLGVVKIVELSRSKTG